MKLGFIATGWGWGIEGVWGFVDAEDAGVAGR